MASLSKRTKTIRKAKAIKRLVNRRKINAKKLAAAKECADTVVLS